MTITEGGFVSAPFYSMLEEKLRTNDPQRRTLLIKISKAMDRAKNGSNKINGRLDLRGCLETRESKVMSAPNVRFNNGHAVT